MPASPSVLNSGSSRALIYVAFALTGAVTNLLGPILPWLESQWHMDDQQGGALFTLQFAVSTLTSIIATRKLRVSIPLGMALIALGLMLLAFGNAHTSKFAVGIYGAGLGFAITSINFLVANETPPNNVTRELSLLNFVWVLGAILFPLAHFYLFRANLRVVLAGMASICVIALVLAMMRLRAGDAEKREVTPQRFHPVSLLFAFFFFLYVGVEVGVSGWLPTHVDRSTSAISGETTVALFWAALLFGRLIAAMTAARFTQRGMLLGSLALGLVATTGLFFASAAEWLAVGAVGAGLGFAALFPVNLAVFALTLPGQRPGWVLASAGLGAAVLPALMGVIAKQSGSIRTALLVPIGALALLMVIASLYRAPKQTPIA